MTDVTGDSFIFRPIDIFLELEREYPEADFYQIQGMAAEQNVLSVRQGEIYDWSSQFSVQSGWATMAVVAQGEIARKAERDKWTKGVGIGVGLGVPVLMGLTALATWMFAKRRMGGSGGSVKGSS